MKWSWGLILALGVLLALVTRGAGKLAEGFATLNFSWHELQVPAGNKTGLAVAKFAEKVRAKVGNKPILVHVVVGSSDTGSLKFTLAPYPEAAFPIGDLVNAVQTTLAAYPKVTAGTPNVSTVGKVHTVELADGSAFRATFGA
jgi:hypothetical protein